MSLEDTLKELTTTTRRSEYCAWQALMLRLSDKDRTTIDKALERGVPFSIIIKAMRKEGHSTSNDSLRQHMKGLCKCPKS